MKSSTKNITLVVGSILGALLGFQVAMILINQSEAEGSSTPINASKGVQVGLSALGMLRQISGFGK